MPLRYKMNILSALKEKGYTTYRLYTDRILSHSSVQKLRKDEMLGADGIATLCKLLECQPGDIIYYTDNE